MKTKISKKEIKKNYKNIIGIGYCKAYFLLVGQEPRYYSHGVYGWSCDYYHIDNNTIISTGYSYIDNIDNHKNYELTTKYNEKAIKIYNNYDIKYELRIKKINKLLDEYINEVLSNE